MKQLVNPKSTEELLAGYPRGELLPGWYFRVEEVSAGHYHAEASDRWAHKVSLHGSNPDLLLTQCVESARVLAAALPNASGSA